MWFLIEGHLDNLRNLIDEGVTAIQTEVRIPRFVVGISFPEDQLDRVQELLSLPPRPNRVETERRGVVLLESARVYLTRDDHMEQWESIRPVLEEYSVRWGLNIAVRNPHGRSWQISSPEANTVYILFWSAPDDREKVTLDVEEIFGHMLPDSQHDGFEFDDDLPIEQLVVDDEDTVAAEIHGSSLYVLFDLPHGGIDAAPILKAIMDGWEQRMFDTEEFRARVQASEISESEHSRARYISACKKRVEGELREARKHLVNTKELQDKYREQYVEIIRRHDELVRSLQRLEGQSGDTEAEYASEYDRLRAHPKLTNVTIQGDVISFFTQPLVTTRLSDRTIRDLGVYVIRVNIETGSVRIDNRTRKVGGRNHPHDMESGRLCLGNMVEAIANLTARYQFEQLFAIMVRFLENPNERDSAGSHIIHWPVVEEVTHEPR